MPLPAPFPGLVIHYSFLWLDEHAAGQVEGSKDRPCAVVLAVEAAAGRPVVTVAPITRRPPARAQDAVEIPQETKRRLGLDSNRSWIVVTQTNTFAWPGVDLRPVPGERDRWAYGAITSKLLRRIREALVAAAREQRLSRVVRND